MEVIFISRPKLMPDDVRATCIQIVRGYDRRVREYYNRRREIIDGTGQNYEVVHDPEHPDDWRKDSRFFAPSAHIASRVGEDKAMRLIGLEELPDTKRMRAVEDARSAIGADLTDAMRRKLADAIMLSCKSGKKYRYEILDVEGIGRTDFYTRRSMFLLDIARRLNLL